MSQEASPYEIRSTSLRSAVLTHDIVLSEKATTRKIMKATLVENPRDPDAGFKIVLIHQRKSLKSQWENIEAINLNTLKAGEGVRLDLDSQETRKLLQELQNIQAIRFETGVPVGEHSLTVIRGNPTLLEKLNELMASPDEAASLLDAIKRLQPDLVSKMSYIKVAEERKVILEEFRQAMERNEPEEFWQDFFEKNPWIFGYGLNYKILRQVQAQPNYGGVTAAGQGAQRGDFLARTEAEIKFTVLVEIKTPQTALLGTTQYRNGAWEIGKEFTGGVVQVQANCHTWETEGSRRPEDQENLTAEGVYTVRPKGILVIGNTAQLTDIRRRNTFEIYRRQLNEPEVITFDELYARAAFIVSHSAPAEAAA
ncbi:MAG: Shedu immune nuclease family protein [Patescibacteria group bacterium]